MNTIITDCNLLFFNKLVFYQLQEGRVHALSDAV